MPKLVVFSGAGLSAPSGVATFRDSNGLWANYDPMEVCNFQNWEKNFALVHNFYNLRREELKKVSPNAMHQYLANLPQTLNESVQNNASSQQPKEHIEVVYLTQNVDDLLERAGAKEVVHLHGELTKLICPHCEHIISIGYESYEPKPCEQCGYEKIKPKIVFFYEQAPMYEKMYQTFCALDERDCVLVIGTSGTVIDICGLLALNPRIGKKILNNLYTSDSIDERVFDEVIYDSATHIIPRLDTLLTEFFASN